MSIAHIQTKANVSAWATSLDITFDSNVSAGSLIVVFNAFQGATRYIFDVSDTQGNTYQKAGTIQRCSEAGVDVWYAYNATAGATTITVTMDADTSYWYVTCAEFSGVLAARDPYYNGVGDARESPSWPFTFPSLTVPTDGALVLVCVYDGTVITSEPTHTANITHYTGRWLWYYAQSSAGAYVGSLSSADGTVIAGQVLAFLASWPETWVDIPDWHADEYLDAAQYPGGAARCVCKLWTRDAGVMVQARLVSLLSDGTVDAVVGTSAEVTSQTPVDATFSVTLTGNKMHKLQVTSDTPGVDLFCAPDAKVVA
jgi:hypothetical protein